MPIATYPYFLPEEVISSFENYIALISQPLYFYFCLNLSQQNSIFQDLD